jgi:Rap1a immunity proteins
MRTVMAVLVGIACLAAHAADSTSAPAASAQPLTVDSVNLSGADFFAAYTHTDPIIRERAQLYLLGVMDASEGRSWCSYRIAKSITLREVVFESLRKQTPARMQQRASLLIEAALKSTLPCKVKK